MSYKKFFKDYEIGDLSGFGGTHSLWNTFDAVHKKSDTLCTLWVLDKKSVEKAWFKKDSDGYKKLMDYLRLDSTPQKGVRLGLCAWEKLQEDKDYFAYITERVVGSFLSLYYQLGDLNSAKAASFSQQRTSQTNQSPLLDYFAPDSIVYGLTTLLNDISRLHEAQVIHSNITPANIVVTRTGEWYLCGFAFSENQAFQFEYNTDANAFCRPSAAFMTPKQAVGKYSNVNTDVAQIFNSIFSVFGSRQPYYFEEKKNTKIPTDSSLILQVTEKMMAVCPPGQAWSLAPVNAVQNANFNERFWTLFVSQSQNYFSLKSLGSIANILLICAKEQATGQNALQQFYQGIPSAKICLEIMNLHQSELFTGKTTPDTIQRFRALVQSMQQNIISYSGDFLKVSLLDRIITLMQFKDFHAVLIPFLISANEVMQIPKHRLFLLFEPIVISSTLTKYRTLYPLAAKSGPLAAFSGVDLFDNKKMYKYVSPYNDVPLEPKMRDKDRERFTPNFDTQLNEAGANIYHGISQAIYSNLLFFFNPMTGGRSHYYTLNLVMGAIASQNLNLSAEVLKFVADSVALMTDKGWMVEEEQLNSVKLSNAMANTVQSVQSKFANDDKQAEVIEGRIDHSKPITHALAPCIGDILRNSTLPKQIANALTCLHRISVYFTDEQIGRILLKLVHDGITNISKFPKAMVGFAEFTQAIYRRCSGKTQATLFMPQLLKMTQSPDLTGPDLEAVRKVQDEVYQYLTEDIYKRVQQSWNQSTPQPEQRTQVAQSTQQQSVPTQQVQQTGQQYQQDQNYQQQYDQQYGQQSAGYDQQYGNQDQYYNQGYNANQGGYDQTQNQGYNDNYQQSYNPMDF